MANKKKPPNLLCKGSDPDCAGLGRRCPGIERASCSGWVCTKHQQQGTKRPFTGLMICRVCAQRQFGTRADDKQTGVS
jgi:ribosomal protein L34E